MNNKPGLYSELLYTNAIDFESYFTKIESSREIEYLWVNQNSNSMVGFEITECVGFFEASPCFGFFPGLILTNTEGFKFKLWAVPHASLDLAIDAASKLNNSFIKMTSMGLITDFMRRNNIYLIR
jgi:hypothetical protein